MRRLESAVRIELGIVKDKIEVAVPERSTGWIEVEFGDRAGVRLGKQSVLRVKSYSVKSFGKLCGCELLMKVLFGKDENIVCHSWYNPSCASVSGRMIINS